MQGRRGLEVERGWLAGLTVLAMAATAGLAADRMVLGEYFTMLS